MLIPVSDARPGMVLTEDIVLPAGTVLVNSRSTLTEKIIEILKHHAIAHIHVVGEEQGAEFSADEYSDSTISDSTPPPTPSSLEPARSVPRIEVVIAPDSMSAGVRIIPSAAPGEVLEASDILTALKNHGVVYGIDESRISEIVKKMRAGPRACDAQGIARGHAPTPGKEGEWETCVGHIEDALRCAEVRKAQYFWQIADLGIKVDPVRPGDVVARKKPGLPPVPGKDVLGGLVLIEEVTKSSVTLDSTLEVGSDETEATSRVSGAAYCADGVIGVLPLNLDGSLELFVDGYRMKADLMIHPPAPGGVFPDRSRIMDALAKQGICHGIDQKVIDDIVTQLEKGSCPPGALTVACGTAARDGENGTVRYLFPTQTSLRPRQNADGSVDFKNVDMVHSVSKGTQLAQLVAPTDGTPGTDIMGKPLPCKKGTAARLPIGQNTEIDPAKPDVLIASTDGVVRYANGVVEISEGFVVQGNVDFSTGNITYAKSVLVNGDIKAGFSVECGGDLQVSGTVEDCLLQVGGNVLCRQGFVGQGKGVIEARGDVNIGFIKNQTIRSRGTITIAKEALNANLYAKKTIELHGNPLSIAGGHVVARDSISVYCAGSHSDIRTILEVGGDFDLMEELSKTEARLGEIHENLKKLHETQKRYDQILKIRKRLPANEQVLYEKLGNTLSKYESGVTALERRRDTIVKSMHATATAFIRIDRTARSGVVFKVGERFFQVKDEIVGPKVVRLIEHQIRIV